jgi:hypothetical protein
LAFYAELLLFYALNKKKTTYHIVPQNNLSASSFIFFHLAIIRYYFVFPNNLSYLKTFKKTKKKKKVLAKITNWVLLPITLVKLPIIFIHQ